MVNAKDILKDEENEIVLHTGVRARKGTVYATILNARFINEAIKQQTDCEAIINEIREVIPALKSLYLFELFQIEEWLDFTIGNEGRFAIGLLYLQHYPKELTPSLREQLKEYQTIVPPLLSNEIQKIIN